MPPPNSNLIFSTDTNNLHSPRNWLSASHTLSVLVLLTRSRTFHPAGCDLPVLAPFNRLGVVYPFWRLSAVSVRAFQPFQWSLSQPMGRSASSQTSNGFLSDGYKVTTTPASYWVWSSVTQVQIRDSAFPSLSTLRLGFNCTSLYSSVRARLSYAWGRVSVGLIGGTSGLFPGESQGWMLMF